jgi:uncharacterized glyoxalase superfamily protein PhnB
MSAQVKPVPEGFSTLSPHIIVRNASEAIDFYKKAFAAEEVCRMPGPDGETVMHAELKFGDSTLMLCEEFPKMGAKSPTSYGGSSVTLHLYVEDADALFNRAVSAGATVKMPLSDMFWGDRYGKVSDPYGHEWGIATHKEDLTPEEIGKRAAEAFSQPSQCGQ